MATFLSKAVCLQLELAILYRSSSHLLGLPLLLLPVGPVHMVIWYDHFSFLVHFVNHSLSHTIVKSLCYRFYMDSIKKIQFNWTIILIKTVISQWHCVWGLCIRFPREENDFFCLLKQGVNSPLLSTQCLRIG